MKSLVLVLKEIDLPKSGFSEELAHYVLRAHAPVSLICSAGVWCVVQYYHGAIKVLSSWYHVAQYIGVVLPVIYLSGRTCYYLRSAYTWLQVKAT